MTALHPFLALSAVAAVAVPLLIHLLLRRRRAPVAWGAMRFLVQAYQTQRRRVQLEQLLLLACRCGLVLFFGLGIARLLLGGGTLTNAGRPTALTIVIDDSLTADVQDTGPSGDMGTALDTHIAAALRALDQLDPARGDRAALITLAAPATARLWPHTTDLDSVRRVLRELKPAASAADLDGAVALLAATGVGEAAAAGDGPSVDGSAVRTLLLSEFRTGSLGRSARGVSETRRAETDVNWPGLIASEPATAPVANTWISALTPERRVVLVDPLDTDAATVSVALTVALGRELGDNSAVTSSTIVRVQARRIDSTDRPNASGSIPVGLGEVRVTWDDGATTARSTTNVELPKPRSGQQEIYAIEARVPADALALDNARSTGVLVRSGLRVGLVVPSGGVGSGSVAEFTARDWVELALDPGGELDPRTNIRARTIDPARLTDASLAGLDTVIVLRPDLLSDAGWSTLGRSLDDGRTVMVFPPTDPATPAWPDQLDAAFGVLTPLTREANEHQPALSLQASTDARTTPTLGPLVAELGDLLRGVTVSRSIASLPSGPRLDAPSPNQAVGSVPVSSADDDNTDAFGQRAVLALSDGRPALVELHGLNSAAPARLLLWTISPDLTWTNLPARAVFVPIMQELIRGSIASGVDTVLAGRAYPVPASAANVTRLDNGRTASIDPGTTWTEQHAGRIRIVDAGGRRVVDALVQPDPSAAATGVTDRDRVAQSLSGAPGADSPDGASAADAIAWLNPASGSIQSAGRLGNEAEAGLNGRELSLWLLIAAALLALAEPVLSRIIAGRSTSQGPRRAGIAPWMTRGTTREPTQGVRA